MKNTIGFRVDRRGERNGESGYAVPPADFQHVLCVGATGAGKTASLILPTLKDRIERGHTIVFFDHKGHEHRKVKALAQQAGRLEDVVEIGKPHTAYINLMNELNVLDVQALIRDSAQTRDPYWNNSAANLAGDILVPLRRLYDLMQEYETWVPGPGLSALLEPLGMAFDKAASFQTLAAWIASPEKVQTFQETIRRTADALEERIADIYRACPPEQGRILHAAILGFQQSASNIDRFSLSIEDNNVNNGNNAVLQILDNTIATYARRDDMNRDGTTLSELLERRAILIVDTQSFGEGMLKAFFESLLRKAVGRLRTGTEEPLSVFIDEANRVLSPTFDTHIDVLREARVELIMAIQNVEQMIEKFSYTKWQMIEKNIKHHYTIGTDHRALYDHHRAFSPEPLLFGEETLTDAEHDYFALDQNRIGLKKYFLTDRTALPETFTIVYDKYQFDQNSAVIIQPEYGKSYPAYYYGEETIREINRYHNEMVPLRYEDEPAVASLYNTKKYEYEDQPLVYEDDDPLDPFGVEDYPF